MREIKFRAWDKLYRTMTYLPRLIGDQYGVGFVGETDYYIDTSADLGQDLILMQYTGLKDKNGKEIYEGDIFPCTYVLDGHKDHVYAVAYDLEVAGFRLEHYGAICPQTHVVQSIRDVSRFNACLGNIYENPELLE